MVAIALTPLGMRQVSGPDVFPRLTTSLSSLGSRSPSTSGTQSSQLSHALRPSTPYLPRHFRAVRDIPDLGTRPCPRPSSPPGAAISPKAATDTYLCRLFRVLRNLPDFRPRRHPRPHPPSPQYPPPIPCSKPLPAARVLSAPTRFTRRPFVRLASPVKVHTPLPAPTLFCPSLTSLGVQLTPLHQRRHGPVPSREPVGPTALVSRLNVHTPLPAPQALLPPPSIPWLTALTPSPVPPRRRAFSKAYKRLPLGRFALINFRTPLPAPHALLPIPSIPWLKARTPPVLPQRRAFSRYYKTFLPRSPLPTSIIAAIPTPRKLFSPLRSPADCTFLPSPPSISSSPSSPDIWEDDGWVPPPETWHVKPHSLGCQDSPSSPNSRFSDPNPPDCPSDFSWITSSRPVQPQHSHC